MRQTCGSTHSAAAMREAQSLLAELEHVGLDYDDVMSTLERDGAAR